MPTFLEIAIQSAQQAALAINQLSRNSAYDKRKADQSIVTEADLLSQQIIVKNLNQAFPDHQILSEESTFVAKASPYSWVIDPLDGTKAYAQGIAGYCVMIALLKNEELECAAIHDPLEDHLYFAQKGQGAWHVKDGKKTKCEVSKHDHLKEMPLVISRGFPQEKLQDIQQKLIGPVLEPINSVGIKVGLVVRQKADIYISHHSINYWDSAAPKLILEEAGGCFTGWDGRDLKYSLHSKNFDHQTNIVATNKTQHSEVVKILQSINS